MISKFPFFKQPDQMDCGATCLAMVAKHYGKTLDFSQQMSGTVEIITEDLRLIERFLNPIKNISPYSCVPSIAKGEKSRPVQRQRQSFLIYPKSLIFFVYSAVLLFVMKVKSVLAQDRKSADCSKAA